MYEVWAENQRYQSGLTRNKALDLVWELKQRGYKLVYMQAMEQDRQVG